LTLAQKYTQAQIAERIGVSTRTIRRWKNEGVEPNKYRPQSVAAAHNLRIEFEREHKRVVTAQRRDAVKHPGTPQLEKSLTVLPEGKRRLLNEYKGGKKTKRKIDSGWINYNVSKLPVNDMLKTLIALRDAGQYVQFIYRIPKGGRSANGRKAGSKPVRTGTPPIDISGMTNGDLAALLGDYQGLERGPKSNRVLYIGATPAKRR
jgi:transcriptional regulator with XRE-family HTH domain